MKKQEKEYKDRIDALEKELSAAKREESQRESALELKINELGEKELQSER